MTVGPSRVSASGSSASRSVLYHGTAISGSTTMSAPSSNSEAAASTLAFRVGLGRLRAAEYLRQTDSSHSIHAFVVRGEPRPCGFGEGGADRTRTIHKLLGQSS